MNLFICQVMRAKEGEIQVGIQEKRAIRSEKKKKREKWGGQERKSPDGGQGRYKRRLKNREAVQSG